MKYREGGNSVQIRWESRQNGVFSLIPTATILRMRKYCLYSGKGFGRMHSRFFGHLTNWELNVVSFLRINEAAFGTSPRLLLMIPYSPTNRCFDTQSGFVRGAMNQAVQSLDAGVGN